MKSIEIHYNKCIIICHVYCTKIRLIKIQNLKIIIDIIFNMFTLPVLEAY